MGSNYNTLPIIHPFQQKMDCFILLLSLGVITSLFGTAFCTMLKPVLRTTSGHISDTYYLLSKYTD